MGPHAMTGVPIKRENRDTDIQRKDKAKTDTGTRPHGNRSREWSDAATS